MFASSQERKPVEPPGPALSPSQELLWGWNAVGGKIVAMTEDFPENKYDDIAQKDERMFKENLLHIALGYYNMINAIKGSAVAYTGNEDFLRKKYPKKADIVKYLKQAIADDAELVKAQRDSGLVREFKYPWANRMVHGSVNWMGILEHAGEHYGQLVVYYHLIGMIPPASRAKKNRINSSCFKEYLL